MTRCTEESTAVATTMAKAWLLRELRGSIQR
jgi:hypothetical protein